MDALTEKTIATPYGEKTVSVHVLDIRDLKEYVDVMTISSFYGNYQMTPNTLIHALGEKNVSVRALAADPELDLRQFCNIWLSRKIADAGLPVGRIGCIEMSPYTRDRSGWREKEGEILSSIRAYFHMLHIASLSGIGIETVGLPILGGGSQKVSMELVTTPMINECLQFLKTNEHVKRIRVITRDQRQAFRFAQTLEQSYSVNLERTVRTERRFVGEQTARAFISYSSKDREVADDLCEKLENGGIKAWYAPRDVISGDYSGAIVSAITECSHFIVLLSRNSLRSHHVLNEVDLAFKELDRGIRFLTVKIDEEEPGPSFRYYLSSLHWTLANEPPLEQRLAEFVEKVLSAESDDGALR